MSFEELKKSFIFDYFVIVTGIIIGTFLYCFIFEREATFSLFYFGWVLIFSFLGDLPLCIFYSRKELSEQQWLIRNILHFILLEVLLLVVAYFTKIYTNLTGGIIFAVNVAGVYVLVRFIGHQKNKRLAFKMNANLLKLIQEIEEDER